MIRFLSIILCLLILLSTSCGSRRSKLDHKNLIPEDELVSLLTDIYITDGLLGMPKVLSNYLPLDSTKTYNNIILKHGYSPEAMDKTIKYYFVRKPKKMIKIYDRVLSILSEMETLNMREMVNMKPRTGSIWPGPGFLTYPDYSGKDTAAFDIPLRKPGIYTFTFTTTLFPDDQSVNPGLTAFTCHPDSLLTGRRKYIEPIYYFRDGHPHRYKVIFRVPLKTTSQLRGSLYSYTNQPDESGKHLFITDISLTYFQ